MTAPRPGARPGVEWDPLEFAVLDRVDLRSLAGSTDRGYHPSTHRAVVTRLWCLARPPAAVFETLVVPGRGLHRWFEPSPDDRMPRVLTASEPHLVVWSSPWWSRERDRIRFELAPVRLDRVSGAVATATGTQLIWSWLVERPPDPRALTWLRRRVEVIASEQCSAMPRVPGEP